MENSGKKGQLISLGILLVVTILIVIFVSLALIFPKVRYILIGVGFIVGGFIYLVKVSSAGEKLNGYALLITFGLGIILIFGSSFFANVLQTEFSPGSYVQAPTFYYYECSPASQPELGSWTNIPSGSQNIYCPSNTDQCDIELGDSTHGFCSIRVTYQQCSNSGCGSTITIGETPQNYQSMAKVYNVPSGSYIKATFQKSCVPLVWSNYDGGQSRPTYKPFIIWKVDMFGGGRTEYTNQKQGCNFPTSYSGLASTAERILPLASHFMNSVTGSSKTFNTQTSTSDTHLDFYKTRNYIGTWVPISTENVNFVTYNGKQGYCLNRQIFSITTVTTETTSYKIIDSNFNNLLSSSVTCCPGETQPNQKCNSNFQWEQLSTTEPSAECSAFNACAGADWQVSSSKRLIRYNCINNKCVPETKSVECTRDSDCNTGYTCDTKTYTCIKTEGTIITPTPVENETLSCKWYEEPYQSQEKVCKVLWVFLCEQQPKSGCQTSGWIYAVIGGVFVVILFIVTILLLKKPVKKRRK